MPNIIDSLLRFIEVNKKVGVINDTGVLIRDIKLPVVLQVKEFDKVP